MAVTSNVLYYYRQVQTSITNGEFNIKRLDVLEALEERVKFFEEKKEEKLYKLAIIEYQKKLITYYMNCKSYLSNSKNIQKEILKTYKKIIVKS